MLKDVGRGMKRKGWMRMVLDYNCRVRRCRKRCVGRQRVHGLCLKTVKGLRGQVMAQHVRLSAMELI